jgi:hypothetical protein
MYVHWLDRVSGDGVHGIQHLTHLDQISVVDAVAVAPTSTQASYKGRAGNRGVDDVVSTKFEVAMRFPPVENELGRCGSDKTLD